MEQKIKCAEKFITQGHAQAKVILFCQMARSTWFYKRKSKPKVQDSEKPLSTPRGRPPPGYSKNPDGALVLDSTLIAILKNYRQEVFFQNAAGYKILAAYLKRDYGFRVNHKKIYRLCKKQGLLLPRNQKKLRKNRRISQNRKINGPNQLWQFDIKSGYIHGENRSFYLLAFVDIFTKEVVGYYIGKNCKTKHLKITFEEALRKVPPSQRAQLVIRSDNGPQMTSHMFRKFVEALDVDHEFIPPATPNKNAYIEAFFSIFETEFLQVHYLETFEEAYRKTVLFIEHYHQRRLHGSIKKLPPWEFKSRYVAGEFGIMEVRA